MASTSEVGSNKNAANFEAIGLIAKEMGTLYNPINPNLKLAVIGPFGLALKTTMTTLGQKNALFKNSLADRETAIKPMSKKTTQSLNSFKSLPVSDAEKEHVIALAKKVRGDKKPAPKNPEKTDTETISTSQQSYDNRIANFGSYVEQLRTHAIYAPNETDITITALDTYHADIAAYNQAAKTNAYAVVTARKDRDEKLYDGELNVMDLQRDFKAYLLSLGDAGKPYYKAATKLKFKEVK